MNDATTTELAEPDGAQSDADGWQWAICEIFGHRRHAGRAREEERFGSKMLRIDIPLKGNPAVNGWETHWYGGSSIFSYTLTDEATVMRLNKPYDEPSRYLPAPDDDEIEDHQDELPIEPPPDGPDRRFAGEDETQF
jgi:hypothetical protein